MSCRKTEPEIDWRTLASAFDDSRKVEQLNPGTFVFQNTWYGLPLYQCHEFQIGLMESDRKGREFVRGGL